MCGSSGNVIAVQPLADTRRISATIASGIPRGRERQGDEATRVRGAPLVDVPVVVRLEHEQREVFVVGTAERARAEAGERREAHRGEDAVAVHVADALVHVVRAGTHLGEARGVHPPVFLGPGDDGVEAHRPRGRALEGPLLDATVVRHHSGSVVLVLRPGRAARTCHAARSRGRRCSPGSCLRYAWLSSVSDHSLAPQRRSAHQWARLRRWTSARYRT